uniref:Uncharacterized protein n=1 Tax=Melanopsichium pennsylvanicum 4 TaxID=1398559 RepID=A0A077R512_9BASI|nr:uncharacterized protein BN887_06141 [Melanopsichium pennsylvanicum 4]
MALREASRYSGEMSLSRFSRHDAGADVGGLGSPSAKERYDVDVESDADEFDELVAVFDEQVDPDEVGLAEEGDVDVNESLCRTDALVDSVRPVLRELVREAEPRAAGLAADSSVERSMFPEPTIRVA